MLFRSERLDWQQKTPEEVGMNGALLNEAVQLAIAADTPGTHDMSTLRGWWEEDPTFTQKFYHRELKLDGTAPTHCDAAINRAIVLQHLASPAMWSIFQLQDLLGMDESLRRKDFAAERINVPANPKNYWRYRMHLTLETLLQADAFNNEVGSHIRQNKR